MGHQTLEGGCHCQALRYFLHWPAGEPSLPARRCTCSYCIRFNGTWTSHPDAVLEISEAAECPALRYRFGTGTADFLVCSRCGVVVAAVCKFEAGPKAVVNINTLDAQHDLELDCSDSDFEGEVLEERLARRSDRWISNVSIRPR